MRLAVDVMGGDNAPDDILKGCIEALPGLAPDDRLILVGQRAVIEEILDESGVSDDRLVIEDAPEVIGMDESPVDAVRQKKNSSIARMCVLGSHKTADRVDAVISAGNTGACVSAATMHMRRLPGVHRPGIAVTIPGFNGPVVLCDAGANPEPRPVHLAQYGVMAETYASHVLGIKNPRVAQVNIGAEEAKGTGMIKQVRDLLRVTPGLNYIGYIEGRDLLEGAADVVVTDGFVGNTMLKLAEGLASSLVKAIVNEILEVDPELSLRFEPVARRLLKRNDYHEYGGAPLLGVNGVCIICHGSSKPRTIASAIRNAREFVNTGVNEAIVQRLAEINPAIEPAAAAAVAATADARSKA
ncbi:MAG: phosphate acyltransferase PlsX [Phycisphaeraceae bacterium]|nr:MAG: phosphate acyltransferase PlsX [Phycisphaeraceae bacterium]